MTKPRLAALALLAVLGGALSGILLLQHFGVGTGAGAVHALCGPDEESGCDDVAASAYSTVGGVSLAGLGLVFYASLLSLSGLALVAGERQRRGLAALALALVALALALDVVLFGLQALAIGAYCTLCLGTYAVNAAALVALLPARAGLGELGSALSGEGRTAFAVWAAGSVLFVVSLLAVEHALGSVSSATTESESMLGASLASPSPESEPPEDVSGPEPELEEPESGRRPEPSQEVDGEPEPGSRDAVAAVEARLGRLESQLERARAENRRLRETLDDPEKYQEYQTEKARQEFESASPENLALEGVPFKGPENAPIQVVEYSDFLCPYCRNLAFAFTNYMPQSGGRVAIFFKNYPLDQACNPSLSRTVHDGACELALGAVCAQEQGKFWPFHDAVYAEPPQNPTNDDVVRIASSAGLDGGALRSCLASPAAQRKLAADIEEARRLEVRATPTVFVNGKRLQQIGGFLTAIESEAKRLGLE